jgi:hypothetical protein
MPPAPAAFSITGFALLSAKPDVHDEHTNNQFFDTSGSPSPATGMQASDILNRLAKQSQPFGTNLVINGDVAEIRLGR